MTTGTAVRAVVREIWRYPVKSMAGERLDDCELGADGVLGDRCWAVRDEKRGCVTDARSLPALLDVAARYVEPPVPGRTAPHVELRLPGVPPVTSDLPGVHDELSAHLGAEVTLWPRVPADRREHYARVYPEDVTGYLTGLFGVAGLEDLPDLSGLPSEVAEFQTIPGSYFDAYPVHVVTTGMLDALAAALGRPVDVRRLRPNLVVEGPDQADDDWTGRELRVGGAVLRVEAPCPRCVMISRPQQGLDVDRELLRTVHRSFGHNLGYYASLVTPGRVSSEGRADAAEG
ncbi:MOSC domain-containing protein [Streptomyces roseoverticillatus]|uniref:MOSC domain-containing protein n=1 Tax=Streptomyces roseoverticillatus TaxID=66429 RepID=UPI001F40AA86|nr:MOSC N-terminal beta barrel domain-containing protein [Streptomyces roseoverticillatus]MCF3106793.1 MOSC domain-containing protein [Streptomyces roseoverticillatus]